MKRARAPESRSKVRGQATSLAIERPFGYPDALGVVFLSSIVAVVPGLPDPNAFPKLVVLTLGAALVAPFAVRRWVNGWGETPRSTKVVAALGLALTVWICLSAAMASSPWPVAVLGWAGFWDGAVTAVAVCAVFLAVLQLNTTERSRLINWILATATVVCVVGIFQLLGMAVTGPTVGGPVVGTLGNTNFAAAFWAVLAPIALGQALAPSRRSRRVFLGSLAAVCAMLAILTGALQGLVLVVFASVCLVLVSAWSNRLSLRSPRHLLVGIALGVVCVVVGALAVRGGVNPWTFLLEQETFRYRIAYWEAAVDAAFAHPLTGVGPGNLARYVSEFRPEAYVELVGPGVRISAAHNVLLNLAATSGLIAAALWVLVFGAGLGLGTLEIARRTASASWILITLVVALATYLLQAMVSIDVTALWLLGWVVLALALGESHTGTWAARRIPGSPQPVPVDARRRKSAKVGPGYGRPALIACAASGTALFLLGGGLMWVQAHALDSIRSVTSPADLIRVMDDPFTPCEARISLLRDPLIATDAVTDSQIVMAAAVIDPRCGPIATYVAESALVAGDLEQADKYSQLSLEVDPLLSVSWYVRARYQAAAGNVAQALADISEAERLEGLYPLPDEAAIASIRKLRQELVESS